MFRSAFFRARYFTTSLLANWDKTGDDNDHIVRW